MRIIKCNSCFFSTTEADRDWDLVSASGRCPKCSSPLQAPHLLSADLLHVSDSNPSKQGFSNGKVVLIDVKIPFWSMVTLMVQWAIAAIPAAIILILVYMIVFAFLGSIGFFIKH